MPGGLPPTLSAQPRHGQGAGAHMSPSLCPNRALQHSNLLQCLAQCAEVTPYLLVMEFCPLVSPRAPLPALPPRALGTEGDSGTARRVT